MFQCSLCTFKTNEKSDILNYLKSHHCILAEKDETTALTKVNVVKVLNPEFKDTEGYYFESPGTEKEAECSPSKSENQSSEQASNEMDLGGDLERKIEKTRKVTWKKDMCCPVKACGSDTYLTLDSFSNHWIKTHHLEFSMFQCSRCVFMAIQKSEIENHLKSHHCILAEKDETTALTKVNIVKVLNPEFKDTEGYYFESPGTEKEAECSPSKSENKSSEQASNEMDLGGDLERKIEKTRKITWKKDMCCPVKACGSETYLTLDSFSNHWIKTHHLEFSMFQCSLCTFKTNEKSDILNHLKSHHCILAEKDETTALTKVNVVKVLNPEFKDTEGYYFESPGTEKEAECSPSKSENQSSEQASNEMDLGGDLERKIEKTRKVTWKKDMCCPVKACGSDTYLTLDSFSNHWIKTHHLEFSMFQCSRCVFMAIQKSEIENHLKSHHWILAETDLMTALSKVNVVKVLNPEFKDTEGYYFECPCIEQEAECSPSKYEKKSSEQASNEMDLGVDLKRKIEKIRKVTWKKDMCCPVKVCGSDTYLTLDSFSNHWIKTHHLEFSMFQCSRCTFKAIQKSEIENHLKSHHWILAEKDVTTALTKVNVVKVLNPEFKDTEGYYFESPGIEKEEKEAECSPSKSENKSSEQASDVTLGTCEASVNSMKHSLSQNQELRSVIAKSAAGNKEPIEVVFVSNMRCPVDKCGTQGFKKWFQFKNHWKEKHLPFQEHFLCKICNSWKAAQKCKYWLLKDVYLHLENVHGIKYHTIEQDIIIEHNTNFHFIDPGPLYFRMLARNADGSKSASSIQKKEEKESMSISEEGMPKIVVEWKNNMTCPVHKCFVKIYDSWTTYCKHWKMVHEQRYLKLCACPKCLFRSGQRSNVVKHMKQGHNLKERELDRVAEEIKFVDIENPTFIDPGNYTFNLFAKRNGKKTPSTTASSEISKSVTLGTCEASVKSMKHSLSQNQELRSVTAKSASGNEEPIEVVFVSNMRCPVDKCGTEGFRKWFHFNKHWKENHLPFQEHFLCKICNSRKTVQNYKYWLLKDIYLHLENVHGIKYHTIEHDIIIEHNTNFHFIDPGPLYFKKVARNTDGSKSASSIQKKEEKESMSISEEGMPKIVVEWKYNMTCPVHKCFVKIYDSWTTYCKHWKMVHEQRYLKLCACPKCPFQSGQRSNVVKHMKQCHNLKRRELDKAAEEIKFVDIENPTFIDPGNYTCNLFAKRNGKKNPSTTASSEISKSEATLPKKGTEPTDEEERYPKKFIFAPGMPCPVKNCSSVQISSYSAFVHHWNEQHALMLKKFACTKCDFKHIQKSIVFVHVRKEHGMPSHLITQKIKTVEETSVKAEELYVPDLPTVHRSIIMVKTDDSGQFNTYDINGGKIKEATAVVEEIKKSDENIGKLSEQKDESRDGSDQEESREQKHEDTCTGLRDEKKALVGTQPADVDRENVLTNNTTQMVDKSSDSDTKLRISASENQEEKDASSQKKSTEPAGKEQRFSNKLIFKPRMPCPVKNCSSVPIKSYTVFVHHWNEQHALMLKKFACTMCDFKHIQKSIVFMHVRKEHGMPSHGITQKITTVMETNNNYVDVDELYFPEFPTEDMKLLIMVKPDDSETGAFEEVLSGSSAEQQSVTVQTEVKQLVFNNDVEDTIEKEKCYVKGKNEFSKEDVKSVVTSDSSDVPQIVVDDDVLISDFEEDSVTVDMSEFICLDEIGDEDAETSEMSPEKPSVKETELPDDQDKFSPPTEDDQMDDILNHFICIDDIGDEKDDIGDENDDIGNEKDNIGDEKDDIGDEKDDIGDENDDIGNEKDNIGDEKDNIGDENDIGNEKDNTGNEKDNIGDEKDDIGDEKDDIGDENDDIGNEKDNIGDEKDNIGDENDDIGDEKDNIGDENDEIGNEKENIGNEKDNTLDENDDIENEKDNTGNEKDNIGDENDDIGKENTGNEKDNIGNEKDNIEDENDDIGNEKENNGNEKDNIGDEEMN
ncbi:hypothetical protein ACJMK2_023089 [Sinanodonta woodiana]|uniref:C2H2-type domain-containing protein n=1 Tax=Sinanodonta woodiana TaxID=1069815 RepID=A0ABD3T3W4_SINWO